MRFLLAALVVLAYLLVARRPIRRLVSGKILWILGITNGLGFVMEIFGLNFTTATKASLLVNVNVVFMAIFSALLLGERIRLRAKAGIVIGLVGVFLITTGGDISAISGGTMMGDMIIFAGGRGMGVFHDLQQEGRHSAADDGDGMDRIDDADVGIDGPAFSCVLQLQLLANPDCPCVRGIHRGLLHNCGILPLLQVAKGPHRGEHRGHNAP
jgi:uncharacterized membrane protein